MNRKSFMAELRSLLAFLDAAERDRVLNRYERMFDEAGPEGETTVVRCFGSPVRQVLQIEREYREAVANGETPFADGEAAGPEETEAPEETEIIEEEYTGVHILAEESEPEAEEPLPEDLPEELIEEQPEEPLPEPEPEEEIAAEPEPAVLPEIDLDELDFSDLGLTFTKKPAAPVMPAAPEEEPEEEAGETPEEPAENEEPLPLEPLYPEEVLPDDEPRRIESADEILGALLADAAAELLPEEEAEKRVNHALKQIHIEHLRDKQIYKMSGGEKKMASIATILAMTPDIILMDEPSIALDPRNRRSLIHILNDFEHLKIIASHDLDMILETCSRVILMSGGCIVCDGDAKEILTNQELLEENGLELPFCLQKPVW